MHTRMCKRMQVRRKVCRREASSPSMRRVLSPQSSGNNPLQKLTTHKKKNRQTVDSARRVAREKEHNYLKK